MHPALAAALLGFLAAQAQPVTEPLPETDLPSLPATDAPPEETEAPVGPVETALDVALPSDALPAPDPVGLVDVLGRSAEQEDEDLRRSRIPFLPSAAAPVRNRVGTHLAAGAMAQLRTRNLSAQGGFTQWDTDLEVVPGIALYSSGHRAQLTLSYAPRLYFPAVWHGGPMSILHRGAFRLEWSPSTAWTLTAFANGTYGDYSQVVPSSTPGGPGPTPPVLNPVRTFNTFPYLSVDVNGQAAVSLGRRLRLRVTAGWFDVGGVGADGQASQPRTWGPRADASADVHVGARAILTTTVAGTNSWLVGGSVIRIGAVAETWTHRWSASIDTAATLGVAVVNNPPAAGVTLGNAIPVAGLKLTWVQSSRDLFRLVAELGLGPYVDTYLGAAYQRLTGRLGAEWFFGKEWKLEASLASALVPFTIRAPESYAVLGGSVAWSPARWATLLGGGFAQTQLAGQGGDRFIQVTGYLGVSLATPDFP